MAKKANNKKLKGYHRFIAASIMCAIIASSACAPAFAKSDKNPGTGQTQIHIHGVQGIGSNKDSITVVIGGVEYQGTIKGSTLVIDMDTTDNTLDIQLGESVDISFKNNTSNKSGTISVSHQEGNGNSEHDNGLNNFKTDGVKWDNDTPDPEPKPDPIPGDGDDDGDDDKEPEPKPEPGPDPIPLPDPIPRPEPEPLPEPDLPLIPDEEVPLVDEPVMDEPVAEEIITDEETPLADAPVEEVIEDEQPPLTASVDAAETIEDEVVPLAAAPQTGVAGSAGAALPFSVIAAAVAAFFKRRHHKD